ncbi:MAG: sulfatase-like hydrolase/transferase [Gemmataceae bacterium]
MKLVVILIRGLQAGITGPYGNRWVETFSLNTLAVHGVVFDAFHAVHPAPELSRQVFRSGCYHFPLSPGAPAFMGPYPDLLQSLHQQGVATHLIVDGSRSTFPGFQQGWQRVVEVPDSDAAVDAGRAYLSSAGASWLLMLDLAALIPPWSIPQPILDAYFSPPPVADEEELDEDDEDEEDNEVEDDEDEEDNEVEDDEDEDAPEADDNEEELAEEKPLDPLVDPTPGTIPADDDETYLRIRETYAAAVSNVDRLLGDLLDGLPDDVHVLVTADCGQSLGEHGLVGSLQPSLHAETVRVPLILLGPGCRPGRRVEALTGTHDLAPTIAALAGTRLEGAHGQSLLALAGGENQPLRDHLGLGVQVGEAIQWGLVTSDLTFILSVTDVTKRPEMYHKPDDAWEIHDVSLPHLDRLENLEASLRAYVEATRQGGQLVRPPLDPWR